MSTATIQPKTPDEQRRAALQDLIQAQKRQSYQPQYVDQISDAEALGVLIAHWAQWDGEPICEAFLSALEDANYHTLRTQLEPLIAAGLAQ